MNAGKSVVFVLIAVLIAIGATQIIYSKYKYPSSSVLPMYVETTNITSIGIHTGTAALYFGRIPSGDGGRRFINFTNDHKIPVEVQITLKGELAEWVRISDNYFVLQPKEMQQISVDIDIPKGTVPGNYTGNMFVLMKRT